MSRSKMLKYLGFPVVSILLLFSFIRDFNLLFQTNLAVGVDGYYYVLQVDSFVHQWQFYFPTSTPIILVFLAIIKFFVQDTVIAIKIGAIILHILLSLGVFTLLKTLTKNFWFGLIGVVCLNLSNLHLYFISEFLSNLGALVFIVWGVVFLIKGLENRGRKYFLYFAFSFLLAVFSHRSAFSLIILLSLLSVLAYFFLNEQTGLVKKAGVFFFAVFVIVSPMLLAWQSFVELPNSFQSEVLKSPQIPFNRTTLPECLALCLILGMTIFIYFWRSDVFENKLMRRILLTICLLSLTLTLSPFLNHQGGFLGIFGRLMSLSYLQFAIALPLLLFLLRTISNRIMVILGLIFVPFILWSYLSPLPMALRSESINKREQLVKGLAEIKNNLGENPFIIAPHGEQFVVTAITGFASQQIPPSDSNNDCLYWLIHPLENEVINLSESIKTESFILVEDRVLQPNLNRLSSQKLRELLSNNPHLRRIFGKSQVQK